ncbi:MAG: hypothetical protein ACHQUA_02165 [Microgenomates group bacterium]
MSEMIRIKTLQRVGRSEDFIPGPEIDLSIELARQSCHLIRADGICSVAVVVCNLTKAGCARRDGPQHILNEDVKIYK